MKTCSKYILLLIVGILFSGCDDEATIKDIKLEKEAIDMLLGFRHQITALPVPLDAKDQTMEWSSANPEIATVSRFGVVEGIAEGSTTITVKHGTIQKTIALTVTDPIVIPPRVGMWSFSDPANLGKADVGANLELVGSGFASIDGNKAGTKGIRVSKGSYLQTKHGIKPEAGETMVHKYAILITFKIPALGSWYSFYQTDPTNGNDAELFINTSGAIGVGATGYSSAVTANEWHQLVICADLPDYKFYLDGDLINTSEQGKNDRFSLSEIIMFIGDNDGDDAEMDVAEISMWDVTLDELQIKKLNR
ncbi:Ig-like domain-containing protein [Parabacteroides sp. OttesenSCG-928-N08]|nr:Ig-like domain-containing protein [Parabacteroides sp. OttesenSCG-928-N08]